jgi:hypothetical protein
MCVPIWICMRVRNMHVCMYILMCVCLYACMYGIWVSYVCTCSRVYVWTCTCSVDFTFKTVDVAHTNRHTHTTHLHTKKPTCTHTKAYAHTHNSIRTHTHTHTHTLMQTDTQIHKPATDEVSVYHDSFDHRQPRSPPSVLFGRLQAYPWVSRCSCMMTTANISMCKLRWNEPRRKRREKTTKKTRSKPDSLRESAPGLLFSGIVWRGFRFGAWFWASFRVPCTLAICTSLILIKLD